jgi:hypothetical protein
MTWTSSSSATDITWRRLSTITDSDGGVDFMLAIDDQYPWKVWDRWPLILIDDPQEIP